MILLMLNSKVRGSLSFFIGSVAAACARKANTLQEQLTCSCLCLDTWRLNGHPKFAWELHASAHAISYICIRAQEAPDWLDIAAGVVQAAGCLKVAQYAPHKLGLDSRRRLQQLLVQRTNAGGCFWSHGWSPQEACTLRSNATGISSQSAA